MAEIRKYWVKASMRTNLDSMHTFVLNQIFDMRNGLIKTTEIMGEVMDEDRLDAFNEEVLDLINAAWGPVTGREYGRIKEISDAYNWHRYFVNLAAGMDEERAAYSFME